MNKTRSASNQLAEVPDASAGLVLERIRDQLDATDVVLWTGNGQLMAGAGRVALPAQSRAADAAAAAPGARRPRDRATSKGWTKRRAWRRAGAAPACGRWRWCSGRASSFNTEPRFLQVTQTLPPAVVANALAVQEANREYQERALAREGLRRMYIGTLTLSLFLAVFGAVLLAVLFGNQLARPLLVLADGVRAGGRRRPAPTAVLQGKDELGGLTRSFADMTQQLADARGAVEKTMGEVDAARANLQTILDNLTVGRDRAGCPGPHPVDQPGRHAHPARAAGGLRRPAPRRRARPGGRSAQAVQQQFDEFDGRARAARPGPLAACLRAARERGTGHVAGTPSTSSRAARRLPGDARLLVFDDISEIVSAQRAQAWGEVARRLAHEIKNPLTPIQLSAERLEMKLSRQGGAARSRPCWPSRSRPSSTRSMR